MKAFLNKITGITSEQFAKVGRSRPKNELHGHSNEFENFIVGMTHNHHQEHEE